MEQLNDDLPLVSILIPTYNRLKYLKRALDSALSQMYPNLEIIICDNSEGAETKDYIEGLMKTTSNVFYYKNKENIKYIGNMRRCLELANSEYVNFLMDDDLFAPQKIETMMAYCLKDSDIHLVTSPRYVINDDDQAIAPYLMGLQLEKDWIGEGQELLKLSIQTIDNFIGEPTTVLFKKSALKFSFGQYYHHEFIVYSDLVTWYSLLESGKCVYLKEPLSYFRRHQSQTTAESEKDWGGELRGFDEAAKLADVASLHHIFKTRVEYTQFITNLLEIYSVAFKRLITEKGEGLQIPSTYPRLMYDLLSRI